MGRLEEKLTREGRGFLKALESVVRVRSLRSAIEKKPLEVEDIKRRIEKIPSIGRVDMMEVAAEFMLFEYEAFKAVKKLLKEV